MSFVKKTIALRESALKVIVKKSNGKRDAEIARLAHCSKPTVRRILDGAGGVSTDRLCEVADNLNANK